MVSVALIDTALYNLQNVFVSQTIIKSRLVSGTLIKLHCCWKIASAILPLPEFERCVFYDCTHKSFICI